MSVVIAGVVVEVVDVGEVRCVDAGAPVVEVSAVLSGVTSVVAVAAGVVSGVVSVSGVAVSSVVGSWLVVESASSSTSQKGVVASTVVVPVVGFVVL